MKICILLPYANPHVTGWIDEFIRISKHEIVVGVVNSVMKYRNNYFKEVDNNDGYLYFFKNSQNAKSFKLELKDCECFISLGMFEQWFLKSLFLMPNVRKIFILSEPFREINKWNLFARKFYAELVKTLKNNSKYSFLCIGGPIVKEQYSSFGFSKTKFYRFGYFPNLCLEPKDFNRKISIIRILFVGQLIPRKGVDILLRAIKYLQRKYTNWQVEIIGDGTLRKRVFKSIMNEKRVQYIENISDRSIMKTKFDNHDILFLPSYFDGWGAVVNEALSSCCSLLLSQNVFAGVELLKHDENGFKFNPYNLNEVYASIDKYFETPEILNKHFRKSFEIFQEWNHKNAACSFNEFLNNKNNEKSKTLLKDI